jgi:hypothetical protein
VEDSCECIFLAVADNREGVVLKISVWTWGVGEKLSDPHLKKATSYVATQSLRFEPVADSLKRQ